MAEQSLKDKTSKGLFWGGINNSVQQLLTLIFGIWLARILSAEDYGLVGMLGIFTAIASSIQESGFTAALTNKRDVTPQDYNAVFWFGLLSGVVMYVILFFAAPLIADFFEKPQLVALSRVLFLGFIFSGTGIAHSAVLFREVMVKQRAKIDITAIAASGVIGVGMALCGMAYWGIALQTLVYIITVTLLRWHYSPWRPTMSLDMKPLKPLFAFSFRLLLTNIVNQINNNIFTAILGRYYNAAEVGYYYQGSKWSNMGQSVIWGMINGVAQPVLAKVNTEPQREKAVVRKMMRFAAFCSFPVMLGLAFVAHELIVITVTEKWLPCVVIMQLLCIRGSMMPLAGLYTQVAICHGESKIFFRSNLVFGLIQILAIVLTIPYGITIMVATYSGIFVFWVLAWHYFASRFVAITLREFLSDIVPYLLATAAAIAVGYFTSGLFANLWAVFLTKVVVTAVVYVLILGLCGSEMLRESVAFFRKVRG